MLCVWPLRPCEALLGPVRGPVRAVRGRARLTYKADTGTLYARGLCRGRIWGRMRPHGGQQMEALKHSTVTTEGMSARYTLQVPPLKRLGGGAISEIWGAGVLSNVS